MGPEGDPDTPLQVGSESAESGEGCDGDCPMDEEIDLDSLKTYTSPDVLICGNCRCIICSHFFLLL